MERKDKLVDKIKTDLHNDSVSDVDTFEVRECDSDNYSGFSVTVTGFAVPIRPMVEAVRKFDEWKVENFGMYGDIPVDSDSEENNSTYGVDIFYAYIGDEFKGDLLTSSND